MPEIQNPPLWGHRDLDLNPAPTLPSSGFGPISLPLIASVSPAVNENGRKATSQGAWRI